MTEQDHVAKQCACASWDFHPVKMLHCIGYIERYLLFWLSVWLWNATRVHRVFSMSHQATAAATVINEPHRKVSKWTNAKYSDKPKDKEKYKDTDTAALSVINEPCKMSIANNCITDSHNSSHYHPHHLLTIQVLIALTAAVIICHQRVNFMQTFSHATHQ